MELRLKLFGGLQLFWAEEPITQKLSTRARRLLSYLILHKAVSLRRDSLAFTLWPDVGESDSLAMLRRALSELLAALPSEKGNPWLLVTASEVRWNPGAACQIDLADYERLVREDTPAAMKTAAALNNGDLLPEIDEEWASMERERLRQTQQALLSKLAMHHRARGEWAAGLGAARRAVQMDPLAEGPQRDVILLLYESGDRAAALAAYENLKNLLEEELGVAPMPETSALAESIAQGEKLAQTGAQQEEAHPSHPTVANITMVGRESETKFMWGGWQRAAQGHGSMVLVGGEAGIGKTTLARWLMEEIAFQGGRALTGHCYPFEQSLPYQPLVEVLRQAVEELCSLDLLPFYRTLLGRLVPELGEGGEQVVPVPSELRQQLYEAILNAFITLARQKPLLLIIEDAHWMESSTLDWLAYAAPQLEKARLYLMVTFRNTEVSAEHPLARLAGRFTREGFIAALTLSRLEFDAIRELVARITGLSGETANQMAESFYDESGGNPFYVKVLARGLVDSGQVQVVDGRWQGTTVEQAGKAAIHLPDTVQSAIAEGVERLPEAGRAFVRMAAVAGRVFPYDVVQLAAGGLEEETLAGLEQALARGLLSELPQIGFYRFAHHLVQESVYGVLSQPRRATAHRRLAAAYLTIQPQNVTVLAYHYEQAGEKEQARKFQLLAGERAVEMAAFDEAAQYYRAALAAWPENDRPGRAETYRRLGACLKLLGQTRAEIDALSHAAADDHAVGDHLKAGETEGAIAQAYWDSGVFRQALEHAHTAYEILKDFPRSREFCWVLIRTAEFIERADEGAGLERGRQALALAQHLEEDELIIEAQAVLGDSLFWRGQVDEGLSLILDSLRRAKELGKPYLICRMYQWVMDPYVRLCRFHEYRRMAEEYLQVASQAHYGFFLGYAQNNLCRMDFLNGRWKSAALRLRNLMELKKRGVFENRLSIFVDWGMGGTYSTFGDYEKALAILAPLEPLIREMDMKSYIADYQISLADVYEGLGRIVERDQCCREYLAFILREKRLDGITSAHLLDFLYFSPPQPEIVRECLRIMESVAPPWANVVSESALAEARGILLLRDGKPEEAVPLLRKALEGWTSYEEKFPFPLEGTRTLSCLGKALALCGERAQAREALNEAWQTIERLVAELDDQPEMQSTFLHRRDVEQLRMEREKLLE